MAILGTDEIASRLEAGEVFDRNTWDSACIKEASYALRLARDGFVVDGEPCSPGNTYTGSELRIKPGRIAVLSTFEKLNMPGDLSGKIGLRLDFAALGLVGLMGIQVDPFYGRGSVDGRLYIRVANMGNETIRLQPMDEVFNLELHETKGAIRPELPKEDTWKRMQRLVRGQRYPSWTYITRIEREARRTEDRWRPLFLFGVVLIAVTILSVSISALLNTDLRRVPYWIANWGWIVLFGTICLGAVTTLAFVGIEAWDRIESRLDRKRE